MARVNKHIRAVSEELYLRICMRSGAMHTITSPSPSIFQYLRHHNSSCDSDDVGTPPVAIRMCIEYRTSVGYLRDLRMAVIEHISRVRAGFIIMARAVYQHPGTARSRGSSS